MGPFDTAESTTLPPSMKMSVPGSKTSARGARFPKVILSIHAAKQSRFNFNMTIFLELMIRNTFFFIRTKSMHDLACLEDIVIFYCFGVTLHKIAPKVSTASRHASTVIPPHKHGFKSSHRFPKLLPICPFLHQSLCRPWNQCKSRNGMID